MFLLEMRTSTIVVLILFIALGVLRDRRFFAAALAWLFGWEAAFQFASSMRILVLHGWHPHPWWTPVVVFGVEGLGFACVIVAGVYFGIRPSWPLMLASGVCWAIWLATGFHINGHTMVDFSPTAEALNEAAKTLWAFAYLVPLIRMPAARAAIPVPATRES